MNTITSSAIRETTTIEQSAWSPRGGGSLADAQLRALMARARELAGARNYGAEAEGVNRRILAVAGDDTPSRNRLAQILLARHDIDNARDLCEGTLALYPANPVARRILDDVQARRFIVGPTPGHPHTPICCPKSVPTVDPASEKAAEAVLRRLFPVEDDLIRCLAIMAAAIKQVDYLPGFWMVSLKQSRVRLNVSKLTVVAFEAGTFKAARHVSRVSLLATTAAVPLDVREVALSVSGEVYRPPLIATHLNWVDLPYDRLDELVPRFESAHRAAVEEATHWGLSPYLKAHSPGVIAFMNRMLGERIVGP